MSLRYLPFDASHMDALVALAHETFAENYPHLDPIDIADFTGKKCSAAYFTEGLARGADITLLHDGATPIGYYKIDVLSVPVAQPPAGAQELDKLYLRQAYHGRGIGRNMLDHALATPRLRQADFVYLCVWEGNRRAVELYQKNGFTVTDSFQFPVGRQIDCDLILRRDQR